MIRKRFAQVFILLLLVSGCQVKTRFNTKDWQLRDDMSYPHRDAMVEDLLADHRLQGLTYRELIAMLGQPDNRDEQGFSYKIIEDFGTDIDPVHTKNLDIKLSKDSTVEFVEVQEWRK